MPNKDLLARVPILVVEDDGASARLLMVLLTRYGAEVRVARNADEAIGALNVFSPAIVVVDLVLPGLSGLMLVRQIKSRSGMEDVPIIAVSIIDGPETERIARASGCDAYLRKPIDIETFATTIASHLKVRP